MQLQLYQQDPCRKDESGCKSMTCLMNSIAFLNQYIHSLYKLVKVY